MKPSIFNQPKAAPGIKRQDRLSQMARPALPESAPVPAVVLAKEDAAPPDLPAVATPRPDRLEAMIRAKPEPLPPEPPRPNRLKALEALKVEPLPTPEPPPAAPVAAAARAWDFEFERNPNGTIRKIRAQQVLDGDTQEHT